MVSEWANQSKAGFVVLQNAVIRYDEEEHDPKSPNYIDPDCFQLAEAGTENESLEFTPQTIERILDVGVEHIKENSPHRMGCISLGIQVAEGRNMVEDSAMWMLEVMDALWDRMILE